MTPVRHQQDTGAGPVTGAHPGEDVCVPEFTRAGRYARIVTVTRQMTTADQDQEDHEVADHGNHGTKVEVYNGVSTEDEPSAAWGWHQFPRRATIITGTIGGLFLFGMFFGNHHGKVEDIWLGALGALTLIGVFFYARISRPGRKLPAARTTVTAHNKPVGHQEPDWASDQKNLTGVYADLTTADLRAWNLPGDGVDGPKAIETPKHGLAHH